MSSMWVYACDTLIIILSVFISTFFFPSRGTEVLTLSF